MGDEQAARWVSVLGATGIALVAVAAVEVLGALVQGLSIPAAREQAGGASLDLLHRLGFPFSNLGQRAALFLVVAVALMCLPGLFRRSTSPILDRLMQVALIAVVAVAAVLAVGSLLAVRYLLNEYAARSASPPSYARVGFATFLISTLGTLAIAVFGSLAAIAARKRAG